MTPSTDTLIDVVTAHGVWVDWHTGGPKGAWIPPDTISLRYGLDDAQTLCTLAHEFGHFVNDDCCGSDPAAECRADRYAAGILVDPDAYREAETIFGPVPARIAAELGVTTHLLAVWRDTHERTRPTMKCPNCSSTNVSIQMIQSGGKNAHKGAGLLGHTNNAARGLTAVSTLGMSNLLWKKSRGTTRQKFSNEKRALCQDCGTDWKVK